VHFLRSRNLAAPTERRVVLYEVEVEVEVVEQVEAVVEAVAGQASRRCDHKSGQ